MIEEIADFSSIVSIVEWRRALSANEIIKFSFGFNDVELGTPMVCSRAPFANLAIFLARE